jgi:hypothetical protein
MPKASLAPWHHHDPQRVTTRPSWTLAHVDHRLVPPNHHVPDLSRYIRDKVGPKGGTIIRRQIMPFHSIPSFGFHSASRARQPKEGHWELLHRIPSSSSSLTRERLHRWRGNLRISTELTPTKSPYNPVVTPWFWVILSIRIISC